MHIEVENIISARTYFNQQGSIKDNVNRIMLDMNIRYEGENEEAQLELTNKVSNCSARTYNYLNK